MEEKRDLALPEVLAVLWHPYIHESAGTQVRTCRFCSEAKISNVSKVLF